MRCVIAVVVAALAACVAGTPQCTVTTPRGVVDLGPVALAQLALKQTSNAGYGGTFDWGINLCERRGPMLGKQCARQPSFLYQYGLGGTACLQSFDTATAGFVEEDGALVAHYSGTAVATVRIACGPTHALSADGDSTADRLPTGVWAWTVRLRSSVACGNGPVPTPAPPTPSPATPHDGPPLLGPLSPGLLFLVALAVGVASYCVGGVLFNRCRLARPCGWQVIPHSDFWRAAPGLFVDGVCWAAAAATCRPCRDRRRSALHGGGVRYDAV